MGAKKTSKNSKKKPELEAAEEAEPIEEAQDQDTAEVDANEATTEEPVDTAEVEPISEDKTVENESKNEEVAPPSRFGRKQKLIIAGLGLLLILSLTLLRMYSAKTSLNKVTVAGVAAGRNIAADKLEPQLQKKAETYQLKIQHPNNETKPFSLKEAGLNIDTAATIKQAKERHANAPFIHRLQPWRSEHMPAVFKVDEALFDAFVLAKASEITKPAQNATLGIEGGSLKVTPAAIGQGHSVKNARDVILDTASGLQDKVLVMESSEIQPSVTETNLDAPKNKIASILKQSVVLRINGKVVKVSQAELGNWIELTPVESEKTIDVTVNSGKVLEYLTLVTKPYITSQRAQVVSTQPDGSVVILVQGQNGVDVQKKDSIAADIAKKLAVGEGTDIDVPIATSPFKTVTAQSYDKWIAADVTAKRLYAYEKTNLVRTVLVSAGAPGTPTVLGQYSIYSKFAKQDMRGQNVDGSRYFQPNVPWVNYFYKDYAIHGNYWRPASYFGNINSSHGCIGVQNADGEWIFNWAPIGTPVIVYN